MTYPPSVPPATRTDSTPLPTNLPSDINTTSAALTDIINELGASPSGSWATVQARLDEMDPAGAVEMFAGTVAPTGWHICDGTEVSRTTYPLLFAVIGEDYGAGDSINTFAIPDFRGKFPVGIGTNAWNLAIEANVDNTGGSADAVAVAHTHAHKHLNSHNHGSQNTGGVSSAHDIVHRWSTYTSGYITGRDADNNGIIDGTTNSGGIAVANGGKVHTHSVNINNYTGDTGAVKDVTQSPTSTATETNLPPYRAINFIIRLT